MQHALPQQVEVGTAIHFPLDQLLGRARTQPLIGAIVGFKTSHFEGAKRCQGSEMVSGGGAKWCQGPIRDAAAAAGGYAALRGSETVSGSES